MTLEWVSVIIVGGLSLLGLYIRTFVKSTVEKSVEHQFDLKLEKFKQDFEDRWKILDRRDKFRLAALDKRLEAHQIAFRLALEMNERLFDEDRTEMIRKLDEFWANYALYLNDKSRKAFKMGYDYYFMHLILLKAWKISRDEKHEKQLDERFDFLQKLPSLIVEAIDLEAIENEMPAGFAKKINPLGAEK